MSMIYTPTVSEDNMSHENICGIIIIPQQLKKRGETQNVAFKYLPS